MNTDKKNLHGDTDGEEDDNGLGQFSLGSTSIDDIDDIDTDLALDDDELDKELDPLALEDDEDEEEEGDLY
ncbi:MAG: adhesin [Candidatus Pacebacteria bacterium]|nr:adhesin [Candidatus Paceibacterota bacterium]